MNHQFDGSQRISRAAIAKEIAWKRNKDRVFPSLNMPCVCSAVLIYQALDGNLYLIPRKSESNYRSRQRTRAFCDCDAIFFNRGGHSFPAQCIEALR